MLGQPVYILTPDVVGVNLTGSLREGVTATDLVLRVTEMLRKAKVVGKFVEFHGEGAASIPVADRATIGNMAPEYGATMGYFPIDEKCCEYLLATGRDEEQVEIFRAYYQAQGLFGIPRAGEIDYSTSLDLDLSTIVPSVAGPKRPQDRIELSGLKEKFEDLLRKPVGENGYNRPEEQIGERFHVDLSREVHEVARSLPVLPGALHSGGGGQEQESAPNVVATETVGSLGSRSDRNTSARDRVRDDEQPPDARPRGLRGADRRVRHPTGRRGRPRPRRRGHRGHHLLHQHLEPRRDARRRPAREEGRRARAASAADRQALARARLARGDGVLPEDGPADLPRPARLPTRSATAARPASATPARSTRASSRSSTSTTSSPPPCFRATATSRRACINPCAPTS